MNPFRNDAEGRLRALWRLLLQFALYMIGSLLLGSVVLAFIAGVALASTTLETPLTSSVFLAANGVVSLIAALVSVWFMGLFFDRRPLSGFGLRLDRGWWLDFGFGLFLGALLMTGVFIVELWAGWIGVIGTFETAGGTPFIPAIIAPVVLFLCVGFYEELVFRGYQLRNIAEGLNFASLGPKGAIVLAWVISSSVFGLLHLANPNATAISAINITFAGLLLGAGYILTGRLGISIGLHITWNFFQGNVFGFPVSGLEPVGATFISTKQGGPSLWTGGPFGPEAGLVGLAAIFVGILLIYLWVRARYGKATLETSLAEPPVNKGEPPRETPPNTLSSEPRM